MPASFVKNVMGALDFNFVRAQKLVTFLKSKSPILGGIFEHFPFDPTHGVKWKGLNFLDFDCNMKK